MVTAYKTSQINRYLEVLRASQVVEKTTEMQFTVAA